ncbi:N-hydroxyarylamine O-acetyltransferase [Tenacibaculum sp. 190524A05c]|uniref:arylamine N-acetyltransferase family protein n=1 Tax=Tenacibaculum platacis TaxID=3137852 RepID=UPI0031FABB89
MFVESYLKRIDYSGNISPSIETLNKLHAHHLFNIPFENIDIHIRKPLNLEKSKLYNKIITNNRGGICYELNGLFFHLLKSLNFKTWIISGRVFDKTKGYGPNYDHLALIVKIEEKEYLVDVGFGDFSLTPLIINSKAKNTNQTFIIDKLKENYRVSKKTKRGIKPLYIFKKEEQKISNFLEMSLFHQTSSNSKFTQNLLITIKTADGRDTITNKIYKSKSRVNEVKEEIKTLSSFLEKLNNSFGISDIRLS